MITHPEPPDAAGLPGTENFVIPELTKEADLWKLLREFTQRAIGQEQTDPKPDAKQQRAPPALQMATRALALLASTTQVNDAIRSALGFMRSAAILDPETISTNFSAAVHDLVDTLFAHNGFIFQAHLQDSSKKPRVTAVNNLMLYRHRDLLRARNQPLAIDLGAKTEYVTPDSVALADLAKHGSLSQRRSAGVLDRGKNKTVDYGGSRRKGKTGATNETAVGGMPSVAGPENASGCRLRSGKGAGPADAVTDEADTTVDTTVDQLGKMVTCPFCKDEVHSDAIRPHTRSCEGAAPQKVPVAQLAPPNDQQGPLQLAANDAQGSLQPAVAQGAPLSDPQGSPTPKHPHAAAVETLSYGKDYAEARNSLDQELVSSGQLPLAVREDKSRICASCRARIPSKGWEDHVRSCARLLHMNVLPRDTWSQQPSPKLAAPAAVQSHPQTPGLGTPECFMPDCRKKDLTRGLCTGHQTSKSKPCKEAYWRLPEGLWGIRKVHRGVRKAPLTQKEQPEAKKQKTSHSKTNTDETNTDKRNKNAGVPTRWSDRNKTKTTGVSSNELAKGFKQKVEDLRRSSRIESTNKIQKALTKAVDDAVDDQTIPERDKIKAAQRRKRQKVRIQLQNESGGASQKKPTVKSSRGESTIKSSRGESTVKSSRGEPTVKSPRGAEAGLDVSYLERGDDADSPLGKAAADEQLNLVIESTKAWKREHVIKLSASLKSALAQFKKG